MIKHYKMFKKGKNWCFMAIATVAVTFGALNVSTQANADTNSAANEPVAMQNQSTATSSSAVNSDPVAANSAVVASANNSAVSTNIDNASAGVVAASASNTPAQASAEPASAAQSAAPQVEAKLQVAAQPAQVNGWQTQEGRTYYYRNGQKVTGTQTIGNAQYYFNDQGQQLKDYFLTQNNHTYYFQKNGQRLNNGFYSNWGQTYYFGNDGARWDNRYYNNWGKTYYFGNDGARWDNKFMNAWGQTYYFGNDRARWDNKFMNAWGQTYYFGNDGARWDNKFMNAWGQTYYFGNGGVRWDNKFMNAWGNIYYFGKGGARLTNQTVNLGYGDLTFDSQGRLSSTNAFIGSIVNGAIQGWTQHKILPSLTLAQAILESAWGKSSLSANYHNLFGIKGSYHGMSVNMPTYEEYGGRYVLIHDAFRRYPDNNASVQDHTDFLVQNSRYHNLIGVKDANTATYLIRADGYATASSYTNSLRSIINTYNLTRYDQVAFRL